MKKNRKFSRHSVILFFVGLGALIWFLVRVIPKPSRATYPCQQAAFPFASAFVIWLTGILTSSLVFVKAKRKWRRSKYVVSAALFVVAMGIFVITSTSLRFSTAVARVYILANNVFGDEIPEIQSFTEGDTTLITPVSLVGVAKSTQAQAMDIEFEEIESMVTEAIDKAGGLENIISDGDFVLIKPNLVCSTDGSAAAQQLVPEVNGITADYRVVQVLVNIVRELNPSGLIYIFEGSAAGSTASNMDVLEYDLITGIDSLVPLEDVSGAWGDTNSVHLQGVSLPPGQALYPLSGNRYWLHNLYYNADVVIAVPVLKNHLYAGITGSIKNVGIGASPQTIYASNPPDPIRLGIDHTSMSGLNLHYFIHDYFLCKPVDFVLTDGLQGLENGPASSNSSPNLTYDQMNMRLILACNDPVAIDAIQALLMGHDPALIPHLVTLHNDAMGCCDPRLIRVEGEKVGEEKKDFEISYFGSGSKYDDFEPPSFSADLCEVVEDQLHLSLTVDDEVTKVEVSVDGNCLNQIVIGGFDDIYLDLDSLEVNVGTEVLVYAYDQYLNYSVEDVTGWVGVGETVSEIKDITIFPNPAVDVITVRYRIPDVSTSLGTGAGYRMPVTGHRPQVTSIDLYSISGGKIRELARKEIRQGDYEMEIDVSDLPAGTYLLRLQVGRDVVLKKLVKMER